MSEPEKRIALLIDADNAPSSKIAVVLPTNAWKCTRWYGDQRRR